MVGGGGGHKWFERFKKKIIPTLSLSVCVSASLCLSFSSNLHIINTPIPHLCMCVCVQYPDVHFCICSLFTCIIHVCSNQSLVVFASLVTDKFGLFTEIVVCTFLHSWRLHGLKPFLFCPLTIVCVYTFFCSFLYSTLCPRSC